MGVDRSDQTTALGQEQAASGIEGLDSILRGGFSREEMHLIQGTSGTGKTTLALQFLLAGAAAGESGLYITLAQSKRGLEAIARSHGWSLEGVTVHDPSPDDMAEHLVSDQTVLRTADVELGELTRQLRDVIEQTQPRRVVFDSVGVIGLLAGSPSRYHREIVVLRQFLVDRGCTALFLGEWPTETALKRPVSSEFHSLAGSVVQMEHTAPDYGEVRRRLRVIKVRGVAFRGGYHDFRIRTGGLEIYPRQEVRHGETYGDFRHIRSGIESLDQLLGGGLEQGTACLFIGPSGSGKSTLAALYATAAAQGGDAATIFLFEERPETFKARSTGVGIDLQPQLDSGRLTLVQLDSTDISPGEFAHRVRAAVDGAHARVIVIDSLTGYFNAMGNISSLSVQMHEMLNYLSGSGVLTLLVVTQEGFMSVGEVPNVDVSYLSDSILALRFFEAEGRIRRCVAAIKKRRGEHETTLRELFIGPEGVSVGEAPLRQFHHILSGIPELIDPGQGWRSSQDVPRGGEGGRGG
ncbi:circadian clock protein KaiC [Sorangium cellulosum]|uniref:non-specific serine/threonine protein kinase n=1 Tax=Sorangium cellulosum TaxID=56 RepID=A0A2L0EYA1_SORCE|nr:ATPase domain-containing protein [Sorangium cellulosum]AUX44209.1 circadian clock protein KaiC [Sorangium cellulosum]